ncbi:bifunctional diaminohydroxyphosphoribosylaminopyrimidine deaminase/5-amino-6-(5-phosphoribosylamino)uracil reductase RibD [Candidatus Legionella polyplacis]|uniref:Riboflavin biosynthesis protein RibD n=1 Tax=Candidatus Legionella polyplacis TaxID=2005262 RepID=A0ABZ2GX67_9GAMM
MNIHKIFMRLALKQAWLGKGFCSPNPSVGAVVVKDNKIIAKSYHRGFGSEHAEVSVLKKIPTNIKHLIMYVTLEPCNHWGKTPPCVNAIIAYGVYKVVYGFPDPNFIVKKNNTSKILQNAGIKVIYFPLEEVNSFYKSYDYWVKNKKPWITAKIAQSLNGKISFLKNKERCLISNKLCSEFTHKQRLYSDVILTTSKTIERDNPLLNVRLRNKSIKKPIAILDRSLSLNKDMRVFYSAKSCYIYYDSKYDIKNIINNCYYYPVRSSANFLDIKTIISHLGNMGYHDVWVEAGGKLFSNLHYYNLVQCTYVYIAPRLLLGKAISAFQRQIDFCRSKKIYWKIKKDNAILCIEWN